MKGRFVEPTKKEIPLNMRGEEIKEHLLYNRIKKNESVGADGKGGRYG